MKVFGFLKVKIEKVSHTKQLLKYATFFHLIYFFQNFVEELLVFSI